MPLDPAASKLMERLASDLNYRPLTGLAPELARLDDPVMAAMSGRGPEVGSVEEQRLAGKGGSFRIRVLKPAGTPRAVIVYYHGGGWVLGNIDQQHDCVARDLVNNTGATVVLVEYRKAPENQFPTAIEDSYLALQWADAHRAALAGANAPLIAAGDSAGGNIVAVLARWARDRNGPAIDTQVLVYPVTDCDFDRPSYMAEENQLMLDRESMIWFWDYYLPDAEKRRHTDASPLHADDLSGLPPALVYLAEYDPLFDEGLAYAQALKNAGVDTRVEVAAGQLHIFFQMANMLPGYDEGQKLVADYINNFIDKRGT